MNNDSSSNIVCSTRFSSWYVVRATVAPERITQKGQVITKGWSYTATKLKEEEYKRWN